MANPNFIATYSSDEVYFGQDPTLCITDVVNEKANLDHTHSGYAVTSHTHFGYASQSDLDLLEDVVATKANATHNHAEYASSSHTHNNYAVSGHDHDEDYAVINHAHSGYATTTALNEVSATVSGKANASHTHNDMYYTETEMDTKLASKSDTSHTHAGVYDASGSANSALTSAKAYTDTAIANLLNNSTTAIDSIYELRDAMEDNADAIEALETIAASKASASALTSHTSNKSNPHNVTLTQLGLTATATELNYVDGVTSNIQTQLNAKAASNHTHSVATTSANGLMSASDKIKIDSMVLATVSEVETYLGI